MSNHENTDVWPPAPAWATNVSSSLAPNDPGFEFDRHYERPVAVDGIIATIFEFHGRDEGEANAGQITDLGGPGISLNITDITPQNARAVAKALNAAADIYESAVPERH